MSFGRESQESGWRQLVPGHEMAILRTFVVGAGGHARVVVRALQLAGVLVDALYDDDQRLWGSQLYGVDVTGPEVFQQEVGVRSLGKSRIEVDHYGPAAKLRGLDRPVDRFPRRVVFVKLPGYPIMGGFYADYELREGFHYVGGFPRPHLGDILFA